MANEVAYAASARSYHERVVAALDSIRVQDLVRAAQRLDEARRAGSSVFIIGNGGSASTASHMATDLGVGSHKVGLGIRSISLSDNSSALTATANDISFDRVFAEQLILLANPEDVLVAISASGNSPNVVVAAEEARRLGVTVIGITGFDGGRLNSISDICVHVATSAGDYGPAEDAHLIVNHMLTELLRDPVHHVLTK